MEQDTVFEASTLEEDLLNDENIYNNIEDDSGLVETKQNLDNDNSILTDNVENEESEEFNKNIIIPHKDEDLQNFLNRIERQVLSIVFFLPQLILRLENYLGNNYHWNSYFNKIIFKKLLSYYKEHQIIDISITPALFNEDICKYINNSLISQAADYINFEEYIEILLEYSNKKEISLAINELNKVIEEKTTTDSLISKTEQILSNLISKFYYTINEQIIDFASEKIPDIFFNLDNETEELNLGSKLFPSVFKFRKGEVTTIAGRPGAGKTTFGLNLFEEAIENKLKPFYFSFEVPEKIFLQKLISLKSKISLNTIKSKKFNNDQQKVLKKVFENMFNKNKSSSFIYSPGFTVNKIKSLILTKIIQKQTPSVIFIDYLGLINLPNKGPEFSEISKVMAELKQMAVKFKIAIVVFAQLSRAFDAKEVDTNSLQQSPSLSDLKSSGGIEENSDNVIFLIKSTLKTIPIDNSDNNDNTVKNIIVHLMKHRNGPLTKFLLKFIQDKSWFINSQYSDEINTINED